MKRAGEEVRCEVRSGQEKRGEVESKVHYHWYYMASRFVEMNEKDEKERLTRIEERTLEVCQKKRDYKKAWYTVGGTVTQTEEKRRVQAK